MKVVVVGGGVAGLVAGYRLAKAGAQVALLEASARWGGQIHTERADGYLLEHGAEGYAARNAAVRELCAAIGIADRMVSQVTDRTYVFMKSELVPAPPGQAAELVGIQTDRADLGHGLTTLADGMGELIETLVGKLQPGSEFLMNRRAVHIARRGAGWSVATATGEILAADAVLIAASAHAAAGLLEGVCASAANALTELTTFSSVSVHLAFPRAAVRHALDASGYVVPADAAAEGLRACTFVTSKFPGRAPGERVLLRAFFRPGTALPIEAQDALWVQRAVEAVRRPLGVRGRPLDAWVARWPGAIARYADDHEDRMAHVRSALRKAAPGVELAGAICRRAGLAGAIESAEAAAGRLLAGERTVVQRYGSGESDVS